MDNYLHQTRKANKPLTERRRRERMNQSLQHLKTLVLRATNKQDIKKLEKADILDMTVRYIEDIQQDKAQQDHESVKISTDSFLQGYATCLNEVSTVLRMQSVGDEVTYGISNHLSARLFSMTTGFHDKSPPSYTNQPFTRMANISEDRLVTSTPNSAVGSSSSQFSPIYDLSPLSRNHLSSTDADISIDSGVSSSSTDSTVWRPW